MKNGAVLAGALALAVSTGAHAQSTTASGLLRQIGGAISGKSGSQAKVSHPCTPNLPASTGTWTETPSRALSTCAKGSPPPARKGSTCATWACWQWPIPPTS